MLSSFHSSFLEAAIPEELAKFSVLYYIIWNSKELNHHYDGIIYSVFVSLGFALIENMLYVFNGGISVAVARAILAVPGHGLFAVLMGYYFSLARFQVKNKRNQLLAKALIYPILFHGCYDFLLFYMAGKESNPLFLLTLLILFAWLVIALWRRGIHKIKKHLEHDRKTIEPLA
jgi:RsiW-degrading membrane proteinase PrsW (M82 family)